MQKALAFLVVAQAGEEGCSVLEMGKRLGVAQSTASRNAGLISDGTDFKGRPGAGLVSLEEDPTDRRAKVMRLTAKGRRVMKSLNAIMEG